MRNNFLFDKGMSYCYTIVTSVTQKNIPTEVEGEITLISKNCDLTKMNNLRARVHTCAQLKDSVWMV